jgi:pimeloyl-ACP methyl ester carboxylesterase
MLRRAVLSALLVAASFLVLPGAAQAELRWGSCVDFEGVTCATLSVPLDRAGVDPGTINLRIGRAGKTSGKTLMYLSGGPGGAGLSEMLSIMPNFPYLVDNYRLIGYDQRGTGRSGLLRCPRLEKDPQLRNTAAAAECAEQIGIARRHYTTPDSVQDIEAIRAELGVEQLTLFGISYGTELALAYARAYPEHVERLVLDSVVDSDDPDPFFTVGFRAMGQSLKSVCPQRCRYLTRDPGGELGQLVAKLRAGPMRVRTYDARGRARRVDITPVALFDLMFLTDYLPSLRAVVPIAVHAALQGDGALLARVLHESKQFDAIGSPRDFSVARYATTCETNPVPWDAGTPIDQRPAAVRQRLAALPPDTFAPFDATVVTEDEVDLCLRWPDVPRAASPTPAPPYPNLPTLLLQGAEDLRTPPEWSARVQQRIPGAIRLVIPGVGHSTVGTSQCAVDAVTDFMRDRRPPSSCQRLPTGVPAVEAAPARLESLRGYPGLPRKVGRTVRAVAATVDDLRLVLSPAALATSGGGLRGGSWEISGGKLILRRYEAVPGVTVSGKVNRTFRLRVAGPKAARGTLTLVGNRLKGRIGGHADSVRARAPRTAVAAAARPLTR